MVNLSEKGVYLVNGELYEDAAEAASAAGVEAIDTTKAKESTIAYDILTAHNTSDSSKKLKIKFDMLTSHDITFVGIIQTAISNRTRAIRHHESAYRVIASTCTFPVINFDSSVNA